MTDATERITRIYADAVERTFDEPGGDREDFRIRAGILAVYLAGRTDQQQVDAFTAGSDHRPTGYGIGALNEGSRSQWYSRGRDQAADAILTAAVTLDLPEGRWTTDF